MISKIKLAILARNLTLQKFAYTLTHTHKMLILPVDRIIICILLCMYIYGGFQAFSETWLVFTDTNTNLRTPNVCVHVCAHTYTFTQSSTWAPFCYDTHGTMTIVVHHLQAHRQTLARTNTQMNLKRACVFMQKLYTIWSINRQSTSSFRLIYIY